MLGRMRGWLDALPVAVSVHRGVDHLFEYVNPMMAELLGGVDPYGRSARDVLQHDKLSALQDAVYATGKAWSSTAVALPADSQRGGAVRQLSWQWQPLRGLDGQVDGTIALAWEASEPLHGYGERHAGSVLKSLDVVVYEFRTQPARMIYINSGAVQVLGYDREDWEKPDFWHRIVLPEDRVPAMAIRRAALERLEDHVIEYRVTNKDGAVLWLRDRTQVKDDPDGPGVILRGVIVDVTQQKRLEEERRLAQTREVELRRQQGIAALAAGIATDMEDLLISLESCAALLELELDIDHPSYGMIQGVLRRFDRTQDRVQCLKAIAGAPSNGERADLSAIAREYLHGAQHRPVHTNLAANLPRVGADPGQILSVVSGLVSNGLEALGDEPGEVRVTTDLVELTEEELADWSDTPPPPPGRYVRLSVADQGQGMPETVRQRAFEPYFSTKGAGRGLGMASALGVAQAAGGSARLNSKPGVGSVVEVLFRPLP